MSDAATLENLQQEKTMNDPAFVYVVYIRSTPQVVWKALTDAETIKKFWYGRTAESTWAKGASLRFVRPDGATDFSGEVLESDPPTRLVFTFKAGAEPASKVAYDLALVDGVVRLSVAHDGFPANSAVRKGVSSGWPSILSGLKSLLETGESLPPVDLSQCLEKQGA